MVYSDVINNNWHLILPYKKKYTKNDMDKVLEYSLLNHSKTFTPKEAWWIVVCTAIYHDTAYSKYIQNWNSIKEMFK